MQLTRPRFWPAFITLLALTVALSMGLWQLQRLTWKEALIAQAESAQALPVIDLNAKDAPPMQTLVYRNIKLRGKFLHQKELHMIGRSPADKSGYQLLTPLMLDGSGQILLVNRGWVPFDKKAPSSRPETLTEETVNLEGTVLSPKGKRLFTPANSVQDNIWLWYDFPAMEVLTGLKLDPVVVQAATATSSADLPQPLAAKPSFRNDHLGYAITWFAIAASVLTIFLLYHRKREE